MPVLIDESVVNFEFMDLAHRQPIHRPTKPLHRSSGVHQSGIIKYIAEKIGKLKPGEPLEEEMPTLIALGYAWEEFAVSLYPEIVWQPGERVVDGVAMNADGISEYVIDFKGVTHYCLEEFKLSFKGIATGEEFIKDDKFWMWRVQGAGYCYGYGALVERWHVCHVRGDYRKGPDGKAPPWGPVYKTYTLRFSPKELEQNWRMLTNYREKAVAEGAAQS